MFSAFVILFTFLTSHIVYSMTLDQNTRVEKAAEMHEVQTEELSKTIDWLEDLAKTSPKDEVVFVSLARLKFYRAINEEDRSTRIKKYQTAIEAADKALTLNSKNPIANFWKAAAIGKQGLDIGITTSLKNAHPMKDCLDITLAQNEKMEGAGPHRAMGRLYYELPGWPISFGDNQKALVHLKKAVELAPENIGNHVYLAQILIKLGHKEEARKELGIVLSKPINPMHKREMTEYIDLAKNLEKKL